MHVYHVHGIGSSRSGLTGSIIELEGHLLGTISWLRGGTGAEKQKMKKTKRGVHIKITTFAKFQHPIQLFGMFGVSRGDMLLQHL